MVLLVAGGEAGRLHLWDLSGPLGRSAGGTSGGGGGHALEPGPDGLFPPVACESGAPVNAVAVLSGVGGGGAGSAKATTAVAAAQDDGTLALFLG